MSAPTWISDIPCPIEVVTGSILQIDNVRHELQRRPPHHQTEMTNKKRLDLGRWRRIEFLPYLHQKWSKCTEKKTTLKTTPTPTRSSTLIQQKTYENRRFFSRVCVCVFWCCVLLCERNGLSKKASGRTSESETDPH